MGYEFKASDVWDFAETISTEKKEKGNELFFTYCPYCNGGASKDKNTFSINLENGTFHCFRSSCGKQGHFVELARDFGFELDYGEEKQYRKLPQTKVTVRPPAIAYLQSRGIGEGVAQRYLITTRKDNPNVLVFPFQDENNVRQFVKYRNMKFNGKGNKEWCETDTKPILFGMAQCAGFERVVVTEGQIDSLSLAECGIKNAVSVPTGARGFTWYQHCREWIEQFKEVVVFGDYEHGRVTLVEELQNRLPQRIKVVQTKDYLGEKDANAILMKYGKQAIVTAVENAKAPEMKNIKDLSTVESIDINKLPKIKTGVPEIDRILGGIYLGQLVVLSGKRGNGKSTFLSQLIANALDQMQTVFIYSGELADYHFKRWLDYQLAGSDNVAVSKNEFGDETYSIREEILKRINNWYKGRAYIYDNGYLPEKESEFEGLLETIEKAVKQYDIKLICIDNLMTAMEVVADQNNLYLAQSNFVGSLKRLAIKYDVAIVLVAHPRKTKDEFSNDDVSGSADITNKADVIMSYNREGNESEYDSKLVITKNRLTGRLAIGAKAIGLYYSNSTKRITSASSPNCTYGWEGEVVTQVGFYDVDGGAGCPF